MAMHNPGSRTFLAIVIAGIVVGFVIAAYFMHGGDSETKAKMDAPVAKQPAAEKATDDVTPPDEMSDDMTPPDEMSEDEAMADDGFTPPDEMPEDAMSDEAPDAMTPAENPEEAVAEDPPPANP
jgi:hypothetical protein